MRIVRTESRFLLLAAPALALLIILTVAGVSLSHSIQAVIFLEGASLGFWGFVAGRRAGLAGWPLARTVIFGLIVGLLVLALQVFSSPAMPPWRRDRRTCCAQAAITIGSLPFRPEVVIPLPGA
jgi:hypothetical protein